MLRQRTFSKRSRRSLGLARLARCSVVVVLLLLATSCGVFSDQINGSGTITTKSYPATDFSAIEIGDDLRVDLEARADGQPSVEIAIDDNLHEHIQVEIIDGRLVVSSDNIAPTETVIMKVSGHPVTGLIAVADADVHASLPEGSTINLEIDTSAQATVEVDADTVRIKADRDSELDVTGRATDAKIMADNDAVVRMTEITVVTADVDARNDAEIDIVASEMITGIAHANAVVRPGGAAGFQIAKTDDGEVEALD